MRLIIRGALAMRSHPEIQTATATVGRVGAYSRLDTGG
jgi:hypothetical protein